MSHSAEPSLPHRVTLGFGGNLDDPAMAIARALERLDGYDEIALQSVSRLYRTPPWGMTDQPWFYNCCASLVTSLAPRAMLDACLAVEKALKRVRRERWGPRLIDIDVLTYDRLRMDEDGLTIPHPHMLERAFVLVPLAEIAGDLQVSGKTIDAWAAACDSAGIEPASDDGDWWRRKLTEGRDADTL